MFPNCSPVTNAVNMPAENDPPYVRGLNAPQRDAVLTTEGPVLVLAGAGTGKNGRPHPVGWRIWFIRARLAVRNSGGDLYQ